MEELFNKNNRLSFNPILIPNNVFPYSASQHFAISTHTHTHIPHILAFLSFVRQVHKTEFNTSFICIIKKNAKQKHK